jgi:DNA-binding transcriptional LysR family regulator
VELRTLEYFVAVAEEGTFTRAAARCHVVQPAISQQIHSLERELGEPLFDRLARRVTLTAGGHALLPYARDCLAAAGQAAAEFAARSGVLRGELRLGAGSGAQATILPAVIGAYTRRYPAVTVTLTEGASALQLDRRVAGQLDAAIITGPRDLPAGIRGRAIRQDRVMAVVAAGTRLARRAVLTLEEVARHPVISYGPDTGLRPLLQAAFGARGLPLAVAYVSNEVPVQVALAAEGIGVALSAGSDPALDAAPGIAVRPLRPAIRFARLLAWRESARAGAPLRAFLDVVGAGS